MTNINWQFSINNLKEKLNFNSLRVINDFEAQALCIEHLKLNDTTLICKSSSNISNNRRVILGPGTGLGVSLLVKIDEVWQVIPAEAGHTVIGFYNNLEQQILSYITNQLNCEPYAEKLISGNGIVNIYNALLYINKLPIKNNITAQDIYNLVLQNNSIALQSIDLFFNFLGTFVGNCIVSYLPYDGVYLTGGVLPKLLPYFMKSNFANRLQNKNLPTIQNIINNTAVHLITAENPALIGLKSLCLK
jgi:glucokinase